MKNTSRAFPYFEERANLVGLVHHVLHGPRQRTEMVLQRIEFIVAEGAAVLPDLQCDEVEHHELRVERLRPGDADLDARAGVEREVRLPGEARAEDGRAPEGLASPPTRLASGPEGVGRLTALRDEDDERPLRWALAVAVLRRQLCGCGDAGDLLEDVLADEGGVVGGPAGDELHARHAFGQEPVDLEVREAAQERLLDGLRALVDLLEHEMLEAAFLRVL